MSKTIDSGKPGNRIARRDVLRAAGFGAALTVLPHAAEAAVDPLRTAARRPNVLLIFMDDMTYRAIGGLTNPEVQTPHIDRLMRRGTTFTHAFNQGAWSSAVCVPSRAMLITGQTLWHAHSITKTTPLLGETFDRAGYTTYFTGKWHNGEETLKRSYRQIGPNAGGFLASTPEGGEAYHRPAPGNHWEPADTTREGHWMPVAGGTIVHSSVRWANAAIDFLGSPAARDPKKPFLLHVAFHGPHDPRQAPQAFLDRYPTDKISIPPNFQPEHPFDQGLHKIRDELLAPFPRTPEAVRLHRHEYYAILTHADAQIGRILNALDASGQANDTIVVFSGDHGLAVGEHGLMGKQNQYDHSIRVPLIFAGAGIPKDRRVDALVYQNGIFPTLCALTGVPTPQSVENRNLVPLIQGTETAGYDAVYGALLEFQRMVRTDEYKLIAYPHLRRIQLFNIREDPWETHDLSGDPKQTARIAALWQRLQTLQRELDDPMPLTPFTM
jgi:arylsulfatase A-like enzyme